MDNQNIKTDGDSSSSENDKSKLIGSKIFYIEDDVFIGNMVTRELELNKFNVIRFSDGNEAVLGLKKDTPDLVILDIFIPGLGGIEVLEEIRKNEKTKDTPVLVISNTNKSDDIKRINDLDGEYIVKASIFPDEIVKKVKETLS